jgi:hypothetical protein
MDPATLSLADLEAFDPYAPANAGLERRFCCPFGECAQKTRGPSHRSLAVNTTTGTWTCHRCKSRGLLVEYRSRVDVLRSGRARSVAAARRAFSMSRAGDEGVAETGRSRRGGRAWRSQLGGVEALAGSPAVSYLSGRGIPAEVARACGARYSPDWYGRPAVVFPIRDRTGKLVAAHGRYIDGRDDPPSRTGGSARRGVYATPGGWSADPLIITEAPIDALSLHACGFPAIALVGCAPRGDWLPAACALQRVLIATDADTEGDKTAHELAIRVALYGAEVARLRPEGAKDWNELLMRMGVEALAAELQRVVGAPRMLELENAPKPVPSEAVALLGADISDPEPVLNDYPLPSDTDAGDGPSVSAAELATRIREALADRPPPIEVGPGETIAGLDRYAVAEAVAALSRCRYSHEAARDRLRRLGIAHGLDTEHGITDTRVLQVA